MLTDLLLCHSGPQTAPPSSGGTGVVTRLSPTECAPTVTWATIPIASAGTLIILSIFNLIFEQSYLSDSNL